MNDDALEVPDNKGPETPGENATTTESSSDNTGDNVNETESTFDESQYEAGTNTPDDTETTVFDTDNTVTEEPQKPEPEPEPVKVEAETIPPKKDKSTDWILWGCIIVILLAAAIMLFNSMSKDKEE